MINEHDNFYNRYEHDEIRRRPTFECVCVVFPVAVMREHFVGQEFNKPKGGKNNLELVNTFKAVCL